MQEKSRRSNSDRSHATREALLKTGRVLFVEFGYADTATPDIVAQAGVTRGALYHHFVDKAALFEAVVRQEAVEVARVIDAATADIADPAEALGVGADAYLDAMKVPGRTRLLLIDGPAVLGREKIDLIDWENPAGTLVTGLAAASGRAVDAELEARAQLLSAAFDRAALEIAAGASQPRFAILLKGLCRYFLTF
ncbi:TetR/AcrR family transcriptional regulator [Rhizobium sp. KVB221]|uniref:TetR/AcrR family transcriptional regulator n=1 Tax=Rhizobium setariae TaxID=2801340 RepID=A0A936YSX8_9HYPH|nr:TetR/AcrR family transcriptional regulator [Rhizobium setariae]MBL0372117.1 TetR/AcrR family transcriptional regulator [Rhizobium setariae]